MALTGKEKEAVDKYLTGKDKKEIEEIIGELWAIYLFIEKGGLHKPWMVDSERFMGFGFFHTKTLVKHSEVLSRLTWGFIGLTAVLLVVATFQLIIYT